MKGHSGQSLISGYRHLRRRWEVLIEHRRRLAKIPKLHLGLASRSYCHVPSHSEWKIRKFRHNIPVKARKNIGAPLHDAGGYYKLRNGPLRVWLIVDGLGARKFRTNLRSHCALAKSKPGSK